ncbi:MAG: AraC family transcriptional regulator [Cyanobacteria bacterium J06649_4]
MKPLAAEISVRAYESDGLMLEQYAYTPGTVEPIPKHSHEAYQFALSFDHQGEYTYRGEKHQIPVGRLSIIHSGEVHAPSDRTSLDEPAHFAMANIHPKWLRKVFAEITDRGSYDPFFATVLPEDATLNRLFMQLSQTNFQESSQLEQDVALWNFLSYLIEQYALDVPTKSVASARSAVMRACDYLRTHYCKDISLEDVSTIAGLSRFHFCRLFRKEMGISVSTYQMQLRVSQAKKLIINGTALSEVAIATGFYDQSHFGKHFKRYVGTTPARYVSQVAR